MKSKQKGDPAAAALLTSLTEASRRAGKHAGMDKEIARALIRVGDALPPARLRAVLDLILAGWDGPLRDALAQQPLPHIEPLLVAAYRAGLKRSIDKFRTTLFLAAIDAGLLHDTAQLTRALDRAIHIGSMAKCVAKTPAPPAVLALARPIVARWALDGEHDMSWLLTFGFVGLLAKEGSKASLDAIEKFAALSAKKDDYALQGTVFMLGKLGKGPAAASLAARLDNKETKRKVATPAHALAEELGLPMRGEKRWWISVWIGVGKPNVWFGMFQKSAQVHLSINPERSPDWEVTLKDKAGKRSFDCRGGEMYSNDFRLPPLNVLRDFPRWLASAGKKIGARFTIADAEIASGRHRGAIPMLRAWLANAP